MNEAEHVEYPDHYELIERAMTLWLWGELSLRRLPWMQGEHLAQYEAAVASGVVFLRRFESLQDLFAAYYRGEGHGEDDWEAGKWVGRMCQDVGVDADVSRSIVEDAAYFRRCRELILHSLSADAPGP